MTFSIEGTHSTTIYKLWNSLSGSSGSVSHRNMLQSLSSSCNQIWRNAFSMSVQIPIGCYLKYKMIKQRSFSCGSPWVDSHSNLVGPLIDGSCNHKQCELKWWGVFHNSMMWNVVASYTFIREIYSFNESMALLVS